MRMFDFEDVQICSYGQTFVGKSLGLLPTEQGGRRCRGKPSFARLKIRALGYGNLVVFHIVIYVYYMNN